MIAICVLFFVYILKSAECQSVEKEKVDASSLNYLKSESFSLIKRFSSTLGPLENYVETCRDDFWIPVSSGYEGTGAEFLISNGLMDIAKLPKKFTNYYNADYDKDDLISFQEFSRGYETYHLIKIPGIEDRVPDEELNRLMDDLRNRDPKAIRTIFDNFDADKNGYLDRYELSVQIRPEVIEEWKRYH